MDLNNSKCFESIFDFARKEVEKQKHQSHDTDYSIFAENVNTAEGFSLFRLIIIKPRCRWIAAGLLILE